ncbi:MAG: hypothetical protein RIT11_617, partial [Pseudomonadota bacterium]
MAAKGKGSISAFVQNVRKMLANGDVNGALAACDAQRGSLANVVRAGLEKYNHVANDTTLDKEQKVESLKKELE